MASGSIWQTNKQKYCYFFRLRLPIDDVRSLPYGNHALEIVLVFYLGLNESNFIFDYVAVNYMVAPTRGASHHSRYVQIVIWRHDSYCDMIQLSNWTHCWCRHFGHLTHHLCPVLLRSQKETIAISVFPKTSRNLACGFVVGCRSGSSLIPPNSQKSNATTIANPVPVSAMDVGPADNWS